MIIMNIIRQYIPIKSNKLIAYTMVIFNLLANDIHAQEEKWEPAKDCDNVWIHLVGWTKIWSEIYEERKDVDYDISEAQRKYLNELENYVCKRKIAS